MGTLTLITGGARAGKTTFALALARRYDGEVTYLATAEPRDGEMMARIAHHRAQRPAGWQTIEAPMNPVSALAGGYTGGLVLFDCVTLWVSNLLLSMLPPERFDHEEGAAAQEAVMDAVRALVMWQRRADADLIVVTNEVGLGIVPADPLTRWYRDTLGQANQVLASHAARVYLVVAGLALELRAAGAVVIDAGVRPT